MPQAIAQDFDAAPQVYVTTSALLHEYETSELWVPVHRYWDGIKADRNERGMLAKNGSVIRRVFCP